MATVDARERITVYLPADLKAEIDKDADVRGQPLTTWVERACRQRLGKVVMDMAEAK